jgi:putative spermidine/putrescine transport system ATP-binding protein
MTETFLSIRGISKSFGASTAVENVSLDIAKGEFVSFLGPSGSGKSTTLHIIAGFFDPNAGDVRVANQSLLSIPSNKRDIGMVFQRYTLFPHLNVFENIAFPLRVRRRSRTEINARVRAMLSLVRLEPFGDRMPSQLSGGQQQRVALARALAYDPALLLMDEPLAALDKKLREELQTEIRRIHRETGVTIVYVTHDQEEALRLSDRIAVFNNGRIEQIGSARDLYDAPRTRFVAGFVGNSNFIRASITERSGTTARLVLTDGTTIDGVALDDGLRGEQQDVIVMMRPDRLRLHPANSDLGFRGRLVDATFLGDAMQFVVRTDWGDDVSVRSPMDALPPFPCSIGDRVAVSCDVAQMRVFHLN